MTSPTFSAMKEVVKRFALFSLALPCFLLSSCLDSEEEYWLNADASGAANIRLSIPAAAASLHGGETGVKELIEELLKSTPAFSTYLVETGLENKQLKINVVVTFDNVLDLKEMGSSDSLDKMPAAGGEFVGKTDLEFQGLNLMFRRRIELAKAIPGAIFIPKSKFVGHQIKTTIHLPNAATSHNATSVDNGGRTLVWTTSLAAAISHPVDTTFTMPLPIPWTFISFVLFFVVLLFGALIYYFVRRKKLRTNPDI